MKLLDWDLLVNVDTDPGWCAICDHHLEWHVEGACDAPGCDCPNLS